MAGPTVTTETPNAGSRLDAGTSTDPTFASKVVADAADRWHVQGSGKQEWGDGTNAVDTNLYRAAAALLQTDHKFTALLGQMPSGVALTAATRPIHVGGFTPSILASAGADQVPVNGTVYIGSLWVPTNMTLTGAAHLIGSVGGTDKVIYILFDRAGNVLANTALAGVTVGTAAGYQTEIPFVTPYAAVGPQLYYLGVQTNGTTQRVRVSPNVGDRGTSAAQTFGTPAAFTPAVVAGVSPIAYVY